MQSFYNSGWLDSNQKFSVRVSSSTAAGPTASCACSIARAVREAVVVPSSTAVPSPSGSSRRPEGRCGPSAVAQLGRGRTAATGRRLAAIRPGRSPRIIVLAGSGSPASSAGGDHRVRAEDVKIPVGGSVTWCLIGRTSITFNSTKANDDIRASGTGRQRPAERAGAAPRAVPGSRRQPPWAAPTRAEVHSRQPRAGTARLPQLGVCS